MGQSTAQGLRTTRLMGYFLLLTIPGYFLCAEFLIRNQERVILPVIKQAFTLSGLLTFFAAVILRLRFLPDFSRATSPAEMAAMVARLRLVATQGMVLSESVAIFGFALRFFGTSRNYTLPFYVLAAFGILLFVRRLTDQTDAMRG